MGYFPGKQKATPAKPKPAPSSGGGGSGGGGGSSGTNPALSTIKPDVRHLPSSTITVTPVKSGGGGVRTVTDSAGRSAVVPEGSQVRSDSSGAAYIHTPTARGGVTVRRVGSRSVTYYSGSGYAKAYPYRSPGGTPVRTRQELAKVAYKESAKRSGGARLISRVPSPAQAQREQRRWLQRQAAVEQSAQKYYSEAMSELVQKKGEKFAGDLFKLQVSSPVYRRAQELRERRGLLREKQDASRLLRSSAPLTDVQELKLQSIMLEQYKKPGVLEQAYIGRQAVVSPGKPEFGATRMVLGTTGYKELPGVTGVLRPPKTKLGKAAKWLGEQWRDYKRTKGGVPFTAAPFYKKGSKATMAAAKKGYAWAERKIDLADYGLAQYTEKYMPEFKSIAIEPVYPKGVSVIDPMLKWRSEAGMIYGDPGIAARGILKYPPGIAREVKEQAFGATGGAYGYVRSKPARVLLWAGLGAGSEYATIKLASVGSKAVLPVLKGAGWGFTGLYFGSKALEYAAASSARGRGAVLGKTGVELAAFSAGSKAIVPVLKAVSPFYKKVPVKQHGEIKRSGEMLKKSYYARQELYHSTGVKAKDLFKKGKLTIEAQQTGMGKDRIKFKETHFYSHPKEILGAYGRQSMEAFRSFKMRKELKLLKAGKKPGYEIKAAAKKIGLDLRGVGGMARLKPTKEILTMVRASSSAVRRPVKVKKGLEMAFVKGMSKRGAILTGQRAANIFIRRPRKTLDFDWLSKQSGKVTKAAFADLLKAFPKAGLKLTTFKVKGVPVQRVSYGKNILLGDVSAPTWKKTPTVKVGGVKVAAARYLAIRKIGTITHRPERVVKDVPDLVRLAGGKAVTIKPKKIGLFSRLMLRAARDPGKGFYSAIFYDAKTTPFSKGLMSKVKKAGRGELSMGQMTKLRHALNVEIKAKIGKTSPPPRQAAFGRGEVERVLPVKSILYRIKNLRSKIAPRKGEFWTFDPEAKVFVQLYRASTTPPKKVSVLGDVKGMMRGYLAPGKFSPDKVGLEPFMIERLGRFRETPERAAMRERLSSRDLLRDIFRGREQARPRERKREPYRPSFRVRLPVRTTVRVRLREILRRPLVRPPREPPRRGRGGSRITPRPPTPPPRRPPPRRPPFFRPPLEPPPILRPGKRRDDERFKLKRLWPAYKMFERKHKMLSWKKLLGIKG